MNDEETVLIGTDNADARQLASGLGARFIATPEADSDDIWMQWRESLSAKTRAKNVLVALFFEPAAPTEIVDFSSNAWTARCETPLLRWMLALGGAATICADNGAIVAIVDSPPALDSAGLAPEAAIAEGVEALARSLALSEGARGVRANTVVTPCRLLSGPPIAPNPPLPGFPGTLEDDVLSAARLLISPYAAHLSGHCLPADRGRAW